MTSSVAVLTVISPPVITLQPKSYNTNIGASVTLVVTATGTPTLNYQWRKNGVDLQGATLSSLTLGNVQTDTSGIYSVYVSNQAGSATSTNAVVNVGTAPIITAQPTSLTVTQGQSASFAVSATGTPLYYQWRRNGAAIIGATNENYVIASTVGTNSATYQVTVSNFLRTVTSFPVTLTVLVPASITVQPTSRIVGEGSNTIFTVTALGTGLNFQWFNNGAPIPNANTSFYEIDNVQFSNAANYLVVVSNSLNVVTSQTATLTVSQFPPAIVDQPLSQSIPLGGQVTFGVGATGTTLHYQWQKGGTNLLDATTDQFSITNVSFGDAGGYSVIITNPLGSVTSLVAALTVGYAPAITLQPSNQVVPLGSNALFTVQVSGTGPISYQWFKESDALPNQTNQTLELSGVNPTNEGAYGVIANSPFGFATSSVATLTVLLPPQITQSPAGGLLPVGSNITFGVTATGADVLSYQWQKDGTNILGATTTNYSRTNLTLGDSGAYTVIVTNFLGSATSSVALLTVGEPPVVLVPPQSSSNFLGHTLLLSCTVTGTAPLNLQWFFNDAVMPDQTNAVLTLTNLQAANVGAYTLGATNPFGTTLSAAAQVAFFPTDSVVVILGNLSQSYDGSPKVVSASTAPPGLPVNVLYDGFTNAPANAGSYTVVGYISDPYYSGSATNTLVVTPMASTLAGAGMVTNGAFHFSFTNSPGSVFNVLVTTNLALGNWMSLGAATEVSPGRFQFTDPQATNDSQRFYRVSWP